MNNDIKYKLANAMKECMVSAPVVPVVLHARPFIGIFRITMI